MNHIEIQPTKYGFMSDGSIDICKEREPGQFDCIDMGELEASYDMDSAVTACTMMTESGDVIRVFHEDNCDGPENEAAAEYLINILPRITRIEKGRVSWPLRGTIVIVRTRGEHHGEKAS